MLPIAPHADGGFADLRRLRFRGVVFSFLLPTECNVRVRYFRGNSKGRMMTHHEHDTFAIGVMMYALRAGTTISPGCMDR